MAKELRRHPFPWVPVIIILTMFSMMIGIIIKGRGSRGSCAYDHVYRKVTCHAKQLKMIPSDVIETAITLQMGNELDKAENYFDVIDEKNFTRFQHLQELKLIKCGIEEIRDNAFSGLRLLRILDLKFNHILAVSERTFQGLDKLEQLYLSNNPMLSLPDFTFKGLTLDLLEFSNNPALTEISEDAFAGASVKKLIFNRCNLKRLEEDTLPDLAESLHSLQLTNNIQPLVIPEGAMKGLRLRDLTCTNNGLLDAEFLEDVIAEEISLDDNPLAEIEFDDSPKLKHTKRLSIVNAKLTRLTKENLSMLINLQELDLENNELSIFNVSAFEHMDGLKELDLSSNLIEGFEGNFTEHLPLLRTLRLDDNDIETVPSTIEPLLSRLSSLSLHGNPLHCNCEVRWFVKWLERHRHVVQQLDTVECETPENRNLTHISDYGFQCRAPTIFNASLDTDGLSLVCTADGDPAPKVTWTSATKDEVMSIPDPYNRDVFQTRSTFTVTKDGNYTCVAENVAGTDSVTVDTRRMPTSGLRFVVESQEIEILETPQGFMVTASLIVLLFYLFKIS